MSKSSAEGLTKARYMSKDMALALKKTMHAPINYEKSDAAGENVSECYVDAILPEQCVLKTQSCYIIVDRPVLHKELFHLIDKGL